MREIGVKKLNAVFMVIDCDRDLGSEISEHFSFFVEGAQFSPRYRSKQWDGKIRLFNINTRKLYVGLYPRLKSWADQRGVKIVDDGIASNSWLRMEDSTSFTAEYIEEWSKTVFLTMGGERVEPYDYQLRAVYEVANRKRVTLISPTASGKTVICYLICRFLLEHDLSKKMLMTVPRKSLVYQLLDDFKEYSEKDDWSVDEMMYVIESTQKTTTKPITLTTWQSIQKQKAAFFDTFDSVIEDEAHGSDSKVFIKINENMTRAEYRVGMTGTLKDSTVHVLNIAGLLGEPVQLEKTHNLIKRGLLAKLRINAIVLNYSDEEKADLHSIINELPKQRRYAAEINWIRESKRRNEFIRRMVPKLKGNTLVLFNKISHGQEIHRILTEEMPDRNIYYIAGPVDVEEREKIRKSMENETGSVIVANSQIFSTGVSIKKLNNAVIAATMKAKVTLLQSLGRLLRLSPDGMVSTVWDLVDNLNWKGRDNYALEHARSRLQRYREEKHPLRIIQK